MSLVTYGFTDFRRLFTVAHGYIWTRVGAYSRLYSRDLWSFLISFCSLRFCDFKFNMATSEGVSARDAVCVTVLFYLVSRYMHPEQAAAEAAVVYF